MNDHATGRWWTWLPAAPAEAAREVRPFLLFVTVVLALLGGAALRASAPLRHSWLGAAFVAALVLHAALYWASLRFAQVPRMAVAYLAIQGVIAAAIVVLGESPALPMGLAAPLIGEAVGILAGAWRRVAAVTALATGALVGQAYVAGWHTVPAWLAYAAPALFFVIVYVVLFTRQLEARARAQQLLAELREAHRELAEYAGRVEDLTLAAERQRLARELHDTLAQGLTGTILQLEAAQSHLERGGFDRVEAILGLAQARAREALASSRRAIDDLRGEVVENGTLDELIRHEVERFQAATGLEVDLEVCEVPAWLPLEAQNHLGRIVAEALGNVARHARAGRVVVAWAGEGGRFQLLVRDDGVGFDHGAVKASGCWGLVGMRERARLAGGVLEVTSAPGKGCEVKVWVSRDQSAL